MLLKDNFFVVFPRLHVYNYLLISCLETAKCSLAFRAKTSGAVRNSKNQVSSTLCLNTKLIKCLGMHILRTVLQSCHKNREKCGAK